MTLAEFRTRFPEFSNTPDTVVQEALDSAELSTSDTFADRDTALALRAAHSLALSPHGRSARLDPKGTATTYGTMLDRMLAENGAARFRVY